MRQMTLPYCVCVSAVCLLAALALPSATGTTTVTPTPPPSATWLDQQPLSNWNRAGLVVPAAPPANGERATSGRCAAPRAPVSVEERAVTTAGWSLYKLSDQ